jgi:aldehyde:ferredoxin oxidoreductase
MSHSTTSQYENTFSLVTNHASEKELEEELESLTKCMTQLAGGKYLWEILLYNARHFSTRGLGCFPKPEENISNSPGLKEYFIKKVSSYCQHCHVTCHHTREHPIPTHPLPTLPPNYKSQFNDHHLVKQA